MASLQKYAVDYINENFFYHANGQGKAILYTFVGDVPKVVALEGAVQLVENYLKKQGKTARKQDWIQEFFSAYELQHVYDQRNAPTKPRLYHEGHHLILNDWRPHKVFNVKPTDKAPDSWVEFMELLFPDQSEREHIEKWFAVITMRPDWRLRHGVILRSKDHGVGKDVLIETIIGECLLGRNNYNGVKLADATLRFNALLTGKRLIHLRELYRQSQKSADALKPLITSETIRIEEKYQQAYVSDFFGGWIVSSNDPRCLMLEPQDRRWFVPELITKPFADDDKKHKEYFLELIHKYLFGDDAEKLGRYFEGICQSFTEKTFAVFSSAPPMTEGKKDLISYNLLQDQKDSIRNYFDELRGRYIFRIDDVVEFLTKSRRSNLLTAEDLKDILVSLGFEFKQMRVGTSQNRVWGFRHPEFENNYKAPQDRTVWSAEEHPFNDYTQGTYGNL